MRKASAFFQAKKAWLAGTLAVISLVMTLRKYVAALLTAWKGVSIIHYVLILHLDMRVESAIAG